MLLIDLAPIRGTDDTLNTLVFIRCRHPLALDIIPSNSPYAVSLDAMLRPDKQQGTGTNFV